MSEYVRKTVRMSATVEKVLKDQLEASPFKDVNDYIAHLICGQKDIVQQAITQQKIEVLTNEIEGIKTSLSDIKKYFEQAEKDLVSARKYASAGFVFSMLTAGKSTEFMQSDVDRIKAEVQLEIKGRHT
jgi:molecular chaperone GrpE (heat shock protein)